MYIRKITEEQKKKLDQAAGLIADVQIELLKEDEKVAPQHRTGLWRGLYSVRKQLGQAMWSLWSD